MKRYRKAIALFLSFAVISGLCACAETKDSKQEDNETKKFIEKTLNLANNEEQEWTYEKNADAWVLSVVYAVAYPEIPEQQGVSVCIPGAYVKGIDTNDNGSIDVTSEDAGGPVKGSLVIDYETKITSTNGQVYTASTAPVIMNTGAAGYGSQNNSAAASSHAADGYINVSCGNRGKQDTATDNAGNTYYTGDAPSCLIDQKAAARFVKYNILLGNLPGNVDCFVSTGGSGGGAHAAMFAATSNHSDYYDYQIEAGAVGVYKNTDGSYSTTVTIEGKDYELSDGAWGCIAYSAITSLYEADMALAFEYYLNEEYSFKTSFQKQLAEYLSEAYMDYINGQNLSVDESAVGFDLNHDGDKEDTISLTIEYDLENHADTNGYYGAYLDLYMAEFTQNLQWYIDNLDYAEGWTWFDESGNALADEEVQLMTGEDKARAFIEGRYAQSNSKGTMSGQMPAGAIGELPDGERPDGERPDGNMPDGNMQDGNMQDGESPAGDFGGTPPGGNVPGNQTEGKIPEKFSGEMMVGTPGGGTTQSATGSGDSANYESYEEMVAAYKEDIEEINAGDQYGNNIVSLYNPLNYIGAEGTDNPTWTKIIMGASEGDISLFSSLNLQIAWLHSGVDAEIEWQWNGRHVPSEVLGESFSLYIDQMYGKYVEGSASVSKAEAPRQSQNGTSEEATGADISSWVNYEDLTAVTFHMKDIAAYRTNGASKAVPGFDVIDYGQEDYVFGNSEKDARHWNVFLLNIYEEYADILKPLFNND